MFSSLTLLRLTCNHDHHIWEPLFSRRLDHTHRGPRDSSLHWAWLWLELLRNSEMLVWLFHWHHAFCCILFLLISAYMSTIHFIRLRGMQQITARHSAMPYKIWLIQDWSTCRGQVWPPIPCLHILHMQFLILVFSRLIWMLMILMVIWHFGIFRVRTWFSRHGYIVLQQFSSEHFSFWLWSSLESFPFCQVQFLVH